MATPRVPIVKGQYPIPYGDPIVRKKIRFTLPGSPSETSSLSENHTTSSEDENYDENEYFVEKIISHRDKPDGGYQYFLNYATELLKTYWRKRGGKPIASSSSSTKFNDCTSSFLSKASVNKKSNGQVKRSLLSVKKPSYRTTSHKSHTNGITNIASAESTSQSLVKYKKENASKFLNFEKKSSRNGVVNKNNHSYTSEVNKSEKHDDATYKDIMEIDEVNEEVPFMAQQFEQKHDPIQDSNINSRLEFPKVKLGPRKPKSYNLINEKESKNMKSIDENWDPYIKEVVAIEPHDQDPNLLWIYISWRSGYLSVHLNTEVNKLCPLSEKGPISIAAYMKQVLTNPNSGYYMKGDVFGVKGDFITSPEISQMFGELIGLWIISQWEIQGKSQKSQIIELGPGRGTLMDDMLRAMSNFPNFFNTLNGVHLIEISPELRNLQLKKLCENQFEKTESMPEMFKRDNDGMKFYWHNNLDEIPAECSFIVAHEFFDALPIHRFELTDNGWREYMVDIDTSIDSSYHFRLILSPQPTKESISLTSSSQYKKFNIGDRIEISPDSWNMIQKISNQISKFGGAALIIDYGQDFIQNDTLRAIKDHKFVHSLSSPGNADLSVDEIS
ncbi:1297_t:CDS:10 [Funneliformis geosporum]|uniref:type II protein arginine methyltransferase n=1 Tax=Funneliformis geosporum TaxID=1117311 RepID=A0A9W4SLM3_9GLOM|nr:1297_t:CDS:10 [Funneliformis geosporum]CAI2173585.1 5079_t:CDS:10 [Funneliformis geosporum]